LLILDNVEDPGDIASLLGSVEGGHVLVTSRRDIGWDSQGLTPIRLRVLTEDEAVRMLCERTSQGDRDAASKIAANLGFLPLALEQAAAFINHHHIPMAAYLERFHSQARGLLAGVAPGQDAQRAVTQVWNITLDALTATNPAAVEILRVLAWLAPDEVPRDLITSLVGGDQTAADLALGLLASYSMVTLDEHTLSTHRLVQTVLRLASPTSQDDSNPSVQATLLLEAAIPDNPDTAPAGWPRWRQLLSHITALADYLPHSIDARLGHLLDRTAVFERGQGLYQQAADHSIRALAIGEAAYGLDHPIVAVWLGNLGRALNDLGRAGEALPIQQRALAISEAALGPDHPDVATILDYLASGFRSLGRAGEALPAQQRALTISEAALGPDHPIVAVRLGNLGRTLKDLGRAAEALPLQERALQISEAAFGPDHPTVAGQLNNLAQTLSDLGRAGEALPLQQRALAISEAALGPDHPTVAGRLNNLAQTLSYLGRAGEALPLQQRALAISEAALGPDHPNTLAIRLWLERLQSGQEDPSTSESR
jgi:tetratricopeptide (TPR) repeat protein